MSRVLVIHASVHGQARRIAERLGAALGGAGHAITIRDVSSPGVEREMAAHDAVLVGGSIRYGRHARALVALARSQRPVLDARPNAFFSVCLSAGGPGAKPATAQGYIEAFRRRTGWEPRHIASFAGALPYTRYGPLTRMLVRLFVASAGGETDTSRDYEYTDWAAVDGFGRDFAASLEAG